MKLIRKVSKRGCLSFGGGFELFDRPRHRFYLDGKSDGLESHPIDSRYLSRQDFPMEIEDESVPRKNLVR